MINNAVTPHACDGKSVFEQMHLRSTAIYFLHCYPYLYRRLMTSDPSFLSASSSDTQILLRSSPIITRHIGLEPIPTPSFDPQETILCLRSYHLPVDPQSQIPHRSINIALDFYRCKRVILLRLSPGYRHCHVGSIHIHSLLVS